VLKRPTRVSSGIGPLSPVLPPTGSRSAGCAPIGKSEARLHSFLIKYFGQDEILVHIGRVGRQVPYGQPVAVHIQIDQAPVFKVLSHGAGENKEGSVLEFAIERDDVWTATDKNESEEFLALLSAGRQITVSFPDGSEPPWVGQLSGARAALQSFTACGTTIDAANRRRPGATQPFSPKEAPKPATIVTQPFQKL